MASNLEIPFTLLTSAQQTIERVWLAVMCELSHDKSSSTLLFPTAIVDMMGRDGIKAVVERCRYVNRCFKISLVG